MSHGSGDSELVEPNLIPLLDLVFQLLMFFIVCVGFVNEQVSAEVRLPASESAKAIEKPDPETMFVNIKSMRSREFIDKLRPDQYEAIKGQEAIVLLPGSGNPLTFLQARAELKKKYEDAKLLADRAGGDGKVRTVVNLRPDGDLELKHLYRIMSICKEVGYTQLKLRALVWQLE